MYKSILQSKTFEERSARIDLGYCKNEFMEFNIACKVFALKEKSCQSLAMEVNLPYQSRQFFSRNNGRGDIGGIIAKIAKELNYTRLHLL